ncbi:serine/threonine protein kinase [Nonomuraea sp. NPDC050556]|uniref:serine/threonine protein kinase n=1 Tax=Nonomuraea sp. NPDC050556 TaxID=3364369 RepID=UPI003788FFD5
MPSYTPLKTGDPERLGEYTLTGRLGEGGQGVVYLAQDAGGGDVAIKWLRPDLAGDDVSVGRFLREVQMAEQVAPFCTAALLDSGLELERPYIVSEFIEGPSLQQTVHSEGPRTGSSLHRLAIGTATALAAIHQAGIVHRDFKPANVILAADGPRVIDFGIARALNANSTLSNMPVGTPSYMPPEQIMGHPVGSAADLFSWASSMVFAASGQAPFGSDTMPAVINRVLNGEPDLGPLQGPLREVVAACLAKDPALRPSAEQVILRLLQHPVPASGILREAAAVAAAPITGPPSVGSPGPSLGQPSLGQPSLGSPMGGSIPAPIQGPWPAATGPHPPPGMSQPGPWGPQQQQDAWSAHPQAAHAPTTHPQGGPPPMASPYPQQQQQPPRPPQKKSRAGLFIGAAVAFVLVLAIGLAIIFVPWKTIVAPQPTAQPTAKPTKTATPLPTTGLKAVPLPGESITAYEHPSDPIELTSYEIYDRNQEDWVDYARTKAHGTFAKYKDNWESLVSPDGRYLAGRGRNYTTDNYDSVVITDRKTGDKVTVKTVKKPLIGSVRAWSKDGSKLLLNVERLNGSKWVAPGFAIVDVAAGKADVVDLGANYSTLFAWDQKETGVVNVSGTTLRFFTAGGKMTREIAGIGALSSGTRGIFSPSGDRFFTDCDEGLCIWRVSNGERIDRFTTKCDRTLGWFDESHLYCQAGDSIQVFGFDGKLGRKLVTMPSGVKFSPIFTPR